MLKNENSDKQKEEKRKENRRVSGYKEVYFLIRRYSPVQGLYRLFLFIGFFSFRLRVSRQMDFPHKVKDNIYFLKTLAVFANKKFVEMPMFTVNPNPVRISSLSR